VYAIFFGIPPPAKMRKMQEGVNAPFKSSVSNSLQQISVDRRKDAIGGLDQA
jgi:hypothetical protein